LQYLANQAPLRDNLDIMRQEQQGFISLTFFLGKKFPRVQILAVKELLEGGAIIPPYGRGDL